MKLILQIETGNAAFTDVCDGGDDDTYRRRECARILRDTARRLEEGCEESGWLHDINGNRVGDFQFVQEA